MPVLQNLESIFPETSALKITDSWSSPESLLQQCRHIILLHNKPLQNLVRTTFLLFLTILWLTDFSASCDVILAHSYLEGCIGGGGGKIQNGHSHGWQLMLALGWELSWLTTKAFTQGLSLVLDFLLYGCQFQEGAF